MKKAVTYTLVVGSNYCPCNCWPCISEMTTDPDSGLIIPDVNWRNFEKGRIIAINYKAENILITDKKEPTKNPERITKYLSRLKESPFNRREIQTNGYIIATGELDGYLKTWHDLGLDCVAISIYHYDNNKSAEVMRPKSEKPLQLERLIEHIHGFDLETRLSCINLKGYIDTPEEVGRLLDFAKKYGIEQVTFRKADIPINPRDSERVEYIIEHQLSKKEFESIYRFIQEMSKGKKPCDVLRFGAKVFEVDNMQVAHTTGLSKNVAESTFRYARKLLGLETLKAEDEIRQLIFFPSGLLTTSWETPYGSAILHGWRKCQN